VAPYEADAQLTYLFKNNKIDLVITEDSDLLLFGASKCFFKMDLQGRGLEIDLDDLPKCDLFKGLKPVPSVDRCKEMLLKICMLSGCDYI
jgi:exonuclease-1